jgi:hypothetical protein
VQTSREKNKLARIVEESEAGTLTAEGVLKKSPAQIKNGGIPYSNGGGTASQKPPQDLKEKSIQFKQVLFNQLGAANS